MCKRMKVNRNASGVSFVVEQMRAKAIKLNYVRKVCELKIKGWSTLTFSTVPCCRFLCFLNDV